MASEESLTTDAGAEAAESPEDDEHAGHGDVAWEEGGVVASSSTSPYAEAAPAAEEPPAKPAGTPAAQPADGSPWRPSRGHRARGPAGAEGAQADVQETVRQVRKEIKKSANWQVLPPILETGPFDAAAIAPPANGTKDLLKGIAAPETGSELLASGVTYALTLCSDLVQQLSKFEERMRQVEDKTQRVQSEVTACFHRTELLREMVEMEQGVRSQDVVQLQLGLKQSTALTQKAQEEVEGRQADLAKYLTGNVERLASALEKRAQKVDREILQLRKHMDERIQSKVVDLDIGSPGHHSLSGTHIDERIPSKVLHADPGSPGSVKDSDVPAERPHRENTVPKTSARCQRFEGSWHNLGDRGDLLSERSASRKSDLLSERSDSRKSDSRATDRERLAPTQPPRPLADTDDQPGGVFVPRSLPNKWTCAPAQSIVPGLCKVEPRNPEDWANQQSDFVIVDASSIWV